MNLQSSLNMSIKMNMKILGFAVIEILKISICDRVSFLLELSFGNEGGSKEKDITTMTLL